MQYKTTLVANEPIVITIGNFDGVHSGHKRLMNELRVMAQTLNCEPVLVTFSPHTLMVVRPDIDVYYLTTLEEKLELANTYANISHSIVINFTREVSSMSATEFMDTLCTDFTVRGLVVGENFSLGRDRMGDVAFLTRYGQEQNILVRSILLERAEQTRISSTRIRTLVSEGHIAEANELLGHPVIMNGIVRHGDKRGRLLGFPTANLLPESHKLLPANGVYAVRVTLHKSKFDDSKASSSVYNGVANIGIRPTFDGKERLVEVHLLDVDLDLYDQYLAIEFIARLRGEQRFSGIDALKTQIAADVQQTQQILRKYSI
jgi:riboflavin kinase / FMN adenylyltransferase